MTLDALYTTILARKSADPDSSWTAQLLAKGPEKCAEKFGEEAIEAIIEAVKDDKAALTSWQTLWQCLRRGNQLRASQKKQAVRSS